MGQKEHLEWETLMNDKDKVKGAACSPGSYSRIFRITRLKRSRHGDFGLTSLSKSNPENTLKHTKQLLGYMRQVFRKQAD